MMTAEEIRDVVLAAIRRGATPEQFDGLAEHWSTKTDVGTIERGVSLAVTNMLRKASDLEVRAAALANWVAAERERRLCNAEPSEYGTGAVLMPHTVANDDLPF